jgi:hypothetical protein
MTSDGYAIIGIDPGLMTGTFAYFEDGIKDAGHLEREKVAPTTHQFLSWQVERWGAENVHIAIERYIITSRTSKLTQQTDALEVTGSVKAIAQLHGITDVRQYAKANLKFASDHMLFEMGWYAPKMRHANDAARQASALLKEVDYPRWCELVKGGTLDTTTNEEMTG